MIPSVRSWLSSQLVTSSNHPPLLHMHLPTPEISASTTPSTTLNRFTIHLTRCSLVQFTSSLRGSVQSSASTARQFPGKWTSSAMKQVLVARGPTLSSVRWTTSSRATVWARRRCSSMPTIAVARTKTIACSSIWLGGS